jgi:hypothetical protein
VKDFKVVKEKTIVGDWGTGNMDEETCGVPNYAIQIVV